jgi:hypothetical protein
MLAGVQGATGRIHPAQVIDLAEFRVAESAKVQPFASKDERYRSHFSAATALVV